MLLRASGLELWDRNGKRYLDFASGIGVTGLGHGEHGFLQLKGHKSVRGMRAGRYNAMPIEGVRAQVESMAWFERPATWSGLRAIVGVAVEPEGMKKYSRPGTVPGTYTNRSH